MSENVHMELHQFYSADLLNVAKNIFLGEFSEHIKKITPAQDAELIEFEDAELELYLEDGWIDVYLDDVPAFLEEKFLNSNIIEYNKLASSLRMLDLNRPPKFLAAKTDVQRCALWIIAKLIENAIVSAFDLAKLTEFQFYTSSGEFLGIVTRIRLKRDLITGEFSTYDFLIFTERYKVDWKDIATLKDCLEIIDEKDYCFEDLPIVLDDLEDLTIKPFVEAERISTIENLYRIKVPKTPIFYRIPFLAWDRHGRTQFYVRAELISEVVY